MNFITNLFALFGILRFRTESIPVREMTYLFLVIGVALINSMMEFNDVLYGIILSNALIIVPAWVMEAFLTRNSYKKKEIVYDNMDDVFDGEEILKEKLSELTGYEIRKIKVTKVDLVRRMATIIIYFKI